VSSFAFKNKQHDVRAIGERLGVQSVLLGSVRRAANRLRVTTQLVDTRDGFQRWSERYEGTVDDVFAIQDEIGAAIVDALNAALFTGRAAEHITAPTANLEAYDTFLQGRFFWSRRTVESTRQAIDCFRRAIALDPRYAPAHAGLADGWVTLAVYGAAPPHEGMLAARRAALTALELDPNQVEARTALALVLAAYDWDWNRAELAFRDALALNANSANAHQWYAAICLTPQRRFGAALDAMAQALALDPLSPVMWATQSSVLLYARRYDESAAAARSALELDGGFGVAHFFLSQACVQMGQFDQGVAHAERALELSGSSTEALAALGHAAATAGDGDRARAVVMQLHERARERYVSPTHLAQVYLGLGETDRALDCLEAAASARSADLIWLAVRPSYGVLKDLPRYRQLLMQLHLEPEASGPGVGDTPDVIKRTLR
jgi:serine/threonine-protein kinase